MGDVIWEIDDNNHKIPDSWQPPFEQPSHTLIKKEMRHGK